MDANQVGDGDKQAQFHHIVAANVRAEMARAGMTGSELAEALGISRSNVSMKRAGQTPFTLNDLAIIAGRLGITPGALVDGAVVRVDFNHATAPGHIEAPAARGQGGGIGVAPTGVDPVTFRFSVERSTN